MYFQSLQQLLHMDGHGVYVWSCYGLFLVMIAWNLWAVCRCRRAQLRRLLNNLRRKEGR
jgi:heme exporter protein D